MGRNGYYILVLLSFTGIPGLLGSIRPHSTDTERHTCAIYIYAGYLAEIKFINSSGKGKVQWAKWKPTLSTQSTYQWDIIENKRWNSSLWTQRELTGMLVITELVQLILL